MSRICELLVLRHARTSWNVERRIQGRSDIALDESGRRQALSWTLPARFAGNASVCSPLRRATETASILGLKPIITDPRLVEMDWGAFEGMSLARLREVHGKAMAANETRGLDFRPPGGESPLEVAVRLRGFFADIGREGGPPRVIVSHRGVMRAMVVIALGWDMLGKSPLRLEDNEGLVVAVYPSGGIASVRRISLIKEPA